MARNELTSHELEGLGLDRLVRVRLGDSAAHLDDMFLKTLN